MQDGEGAGSGWTGTCGESLASRQRFFSRPLVNSTVSRMGGAEMSFGALRADKSLDGNRCKCIYPVVPPRLARYDHLRGVGRIVQRRASLANWGCAIDISYLARG